MGEQYSTSPILHYSFAILRAAAHGAAVQAIFCGPHWHGTRCNRPLLSLGKLVADFISLNPLVARSGSRPVAHNQPAATVILVAGIAQRRESTSVLRGCYRQATALQSNGQGERCDWCQHRRCASCQPDSFPRLRDGCCRCQAALGLAARPSRSE
jgi:hypothetical protein